MAAASFARQGRPCIRRCRPPASPFPHGSYPSRGLAQLLSKLPPESSPLPPSRSPLDGYLIDALRTKRLQASLPSLLDQYDTRAGRILDFFLKYESRPSAERKVSFDAQSDIVLVAHVALQGEQEHVSVCSGFALEVEGTKNPIIVTCAHTLEEIRRSPILQHASCASTTFIVTPSLEIFPAKSILSSLPRSDLIIFSLDAAHEPSVRTLPLSPYPAQLGTRCRAHFISDVDPKVNGWDSWIKGKTWKKWVEAKVMGYRDFAGREAEPGTYDTLSHLLFNPPPTPGSSGGPIVDEESGAVIGVMLGSRMNSRIEGTRGWGVPSELIYEMFNLPGLSR